MATFILNTDCLREEPGLQADLARYLGVTRGAVAKWKRVPAERVLAVEAFTGISRHILRPDIYPPPLRNVEQRLATSLPKGKHKIASKAVA